MSEDVLRSLGIEPVDTSQLRARLVEAGQVLAGVRLTETSRDGQVQATVDGTGVLLGLAITDRRRTPDDAPALSAAIVEAVRCAKARAAMAAQTGAAQALQPPQPVPRAVRPPSFVPPAFEPPPSEPPAEGAHPVAQQNADEQADFDEIDFLDDEPGDQQVTW
jgi:DNA-binding protein YbaB